PAGPTFPSAATARTSRSAIDRSSNGCSRTPARGSSKLAPSLLQEAAMHIHVGYEFVYDCPQPTPMILTLDVHPSRAADIVREPTLRTDPEVPQTSYVDTFGNVCRR